MIIVCKQPKVIHVVKVAGPVLFMMPEEETEGDGMRSTCFPGAEWAYQFTGEREAWGGYYTK